MSLVFTYSGTDNKFHPTTVTPILGTFVISGIDVSTNIKAEIQLPSLESGNILFRTTSSNIKIEKNVIENTKEVVWGIEGLVCDVIVALNSICYDAYIAGSLSSSLNICSGIISRLGDGNIKILSEPLNPSEEPKQIITEPKYNRDDLEIKITVRANNVSVSQFVYLTADKQNTDKLNWVSVWFKPQQQFNFTPCLDMNKKPRLFSDITCRIRETAGNYITSILVSGPVEQINNIFKYRGYYEDLHISAGSGGSLPSFFRELEVSRLVYTNVCNMPLDPNFPCDPWMPHPTDKLTNKILFQWFNS